MALDPNIYSLIMAEDEPTAQQRAMQMAAALRGQDQVGTLALFGQNSGTKDFGRAQTMQTKNREDQLADAGKYRLQMAMEKEKEKTKAKGRVLDQTTELRKELMGNQTVKNTQLIGEGYAKMREAFKNPGPASDMGMIYGLMKMYDPGSTVREGEYAQAAQATGVPGQILNLYNRLTKGEKLNPAVRADFMKQAGLLMQAQMARYQPLANEYGRLAEESGAARNDVVLDLGFEGQDATAAGGPDVQEPPMPKRTVNGETRVWNGKQWVPPKGQ